MRSHTNLQLYTPVQWYTHVHAISLYPRHTSLVPVIIYSINGISRERACETECHCRITPPPVANGLSKPVPITGVI